MKINILYFSCGRDEKMLEMSIDSIRRNYSPNEIFVAEDPNDPITTKLDGVRYRFRDGSSTKLYGVDNIKEMYTHFEQVSYGCDYVQKIDSDMLCLSSYCYDKLENEKPDALGGFPMANPDIIPPKHFGGGTYFIKADLARKLKDLNPLEAKDLWGFLNMPEDMVTSFLLTKLTRNVIVDGTEMNQKGKFYGDIYLSRHLLDMKEYGFLHCRTNPFTMKFLYERYYN